MRIFDNIFWATISGFKCERFRRHIWSNIVKYRQYRATETSKTFDNYRQITSGFMINSIELHTLSEDAVC